MALISLQKKITFYIIVLIGVSLTAFILVEIILKVSNVWIGRHSDMMFTIIEYDRMLGWRMKPNINQKVDMVDVEDLPVRSNSLGFRDREFVFKKHPSNCRIVFLGDSFTWGLGIREEERFSNLVGNAKRGWESLNFAIPAYGIDQSLLVWQNIVRNYQPDIVVLTIYQNDYVDNMYVIRYGRSKPYFELKENNRIELKNMPVRPRESWKYGVFSKVAPVYVSFFSQSEQKRSRLLHWLVKHSDLIRFFYTTSRKRDYAKETYLLKRPPDKLELTQAEEMQVRLLSVLVIKFAEEVKAQGAYFMVVLSGDSIPQFTLQKKIFEDTGISYIDATTEVLGKKLLEGRRAVYYPYSGHWTKAAHRIVAELLVKQLKINNERLKK